MPGRGRREQGTGNREQRVGNRKQAAESKEQRVGSREQGAESRELRSRNKKGKKFFCNTINGYECSTEDMVVYFKNGRTRDKIEDGVEAGYFKMMKSNVGFGALRKINLLRIPRWIFSYYRLFSYT